MENETIVTVRREGGFAGVSRDITLKSGSLSPEESGMLRKLIEDAHFFESPPSTMESQGADRFTYEVTAEDSGRRHTVRTNVAETDPALDALIRFVKTHAR